MIDSVRLARLRWRCRRGMLENDLVLSRYLDARGGAIADDEVAMLDRLLDLPDQDLWDLIAGRVEPQAAVAPLVAALRDPRQASDPPTRDTGIGRRSTHGEER
jgi:antitoxin CptB